jgi:hypothetical protein
VINPDEAELGKRPWQVFDQEIFPHLTVERLFGDLQSLQGDGRFWQASCPIHQDKQGAFSIDPQTLEWNCFLGCGGGGPVQYLQMVRGLSWMDAAMELARLGGVDPGILEPWGRLWTEQDFALHDQLERRSSLLGIFMAYARSVYHSPASRTLRSELVDRYGFSEKTVGKLDLGLYTAPEDVWHYLKKSGRELEEVREWGFFETQWTGCILGAWKDLRGRIINIWGWQPREALGEAARFEGTCCFPRAMPWEGRESLCIWTPPLGRKKPNFYWWRTRWRRCSLVLWDWKGRFPSPQQEISALRRWRPFKSI